jgi:Rieske Fe-S protein
MRRLRIALSLLGVVLLTAVIVFLWPRDRQPAGQVVAGTVDEVQSRQVVYLAEPRVFVVAADSGFVALSDDARHVGDRVLYCAQDKTFSAPHGERFDRLGRYMGGPAAGDMGRYPVKVEEDRVVIDVSGDLELPGRSPSSDAAAGPHCEGAENPPGFFQEEAP